MIRAVAAWLALALLAGGVGAAPPPRPGGIQGTVTSVVDGDSLWVTPASGGRAIEVRLAGVDAPEICQEFGAEAKKFLADLVLKQPVRLVVGGNDGNANDVHGRTLGTVYLSDVEVNRRLVEEGMAWSVRIKWDQGPYVSQERMAKALSRGLHRVGAAAIMPRDFRQRHGPCAAAEPPAADPAAGRKAPTTAPAATGPFRCDTRTRCSQMTSCAEAQFFLKNCPGVQLDGNRDGVPCETQWCRR